MEDGSGTEQEERAGPSRGTKSRKDHLSSIQVQKE